MTARAAWGGLVLVSVLMFFSCSGRNGRPPDVILITIHGLGSEAGGLAAWASGQRDPGLLFTSLVVPSPLCLPSHASLMTGLPPIVHGARLDGWKIRESRTLAMAMREAGRRTAAFTGSGRLDPFSGLGRGFDLFDYPMGDGVQELSLRSRRPAEETLAAAFLWLHSLPLDQPAFLWVEIHDLDVADSDPVTLASARDRALDLVGRFRKRIQELGRGEAIFIVTGVHGLSTGEPERGHGHFLPPEQVRTAAWVTAEGMKPGTRTEVLPLTALHDEVLGLAGLDVPSRPDRGVPGTETLLPSRDSGARGLVRRGPDSDPVPLREGALHLPPDAPLPRDHAGIYRDLEEGRRALDRRRIQEAVSAFDRALGLSPGVPGALAGRALAHIAGGEPSKAAPDLRLLEEKGSRLGDPYWTALARIALAETGEEDPETTLPQVERGPTALSGAARRAAARARLESGRTAEAVALLQEELSEEPQDDPARLLLARARWSQHDLAGAASALQEVVRRRPYAREPRQALADLWIEGGDLWEALLVYEDGLQVYPRDPALNEGAADVALRARRYDMALDYLRAALEEAPERVSAHLMKAVALQGARRPEEAAKELDWVLARHPANPRALALKERLASEGDGREAEEETEPMVSPKP